MGNDIIIRTVYDALMNIAMIPRMSNAVKDDCNCFAFIVANKSSNILKKGDLRPTYHENLCNLVKQCSSCIVKPFLQPCI